MSFHIFFIAGADKSNIVQLRSRQSRADPMQSPRGQTSSQSGKERLRRDEAGESRSL